MRYGIDRVARYTKVEDFYTSIGMPVRLRQIGIGDENFAMAQKAVDEKRGQPCAFGPSGYRKDIQISVIIMLELLFSAPRLWIFLIFAAQVIIYLIIMSPKINLHLGVFLGISIAFLAMFVLILIFWIITIWAVLECFWLYCIARA